MSDKWRIHRVAPGLWAIDSPLGWSIPNLTEHYMFVSGWRAIQFFNNHWKSLLN